MDNALPEVPQSWLAPHIRGCLVTLRHFGEKSILVKEVGETEMNLLKCLTCITIILGKTCQREEKVEFVTQQP